MGLSAPKDATAREVRRLTGWVISIAVIVAVVLFMVSL